MTTQAEGTTSGSASQAGATGTQTASGAEGKEGSTSATSTTEKSNAARSMLRGGEAEAQDKGGTDGQATQTDKSKDEQSASGGELTITVPDGANVDEAALAAFKTFAKESGLTGEVASKLVAWSLERGKAAAEAADKARFEQSEAWFKELENDPDFGKANLEKSQLSVRRAVAKFFDDPLLNFLTEIGVDNHPGFVKMLKRLGDTLPEDDMATDRRAGNGAQGGSFDREAQLRTDYPSMFAEQK